MIKAMGPMTAQAIQALLDPTGCVVVREVGDGVVGDVVIAEVMGDVGEVAFNRSLQKGIA
jgi:hypothetical protein